MPKRSRPTKSVETDPRVEARKLMIQARDRLLLELRAVEEFIQRMDSGQAPSQHDAKKSMTALFAARDRSQPGSVEEQHAAEKILESIFPDTNAG